MTDCRIPILPVKNLGGGDGKAMISLLLKCYGGFICELIQNKVGGFVY